MDINKSLSAFQFVGSSVRHLNIDNSFVRYTDSEDIEKKFGINTEIIDIGNDDKDKNSLLGILRLIVKLDINNKEKNFSITLAIEGCFKANNIDEEKFKTMLELNGATTLYSCARSVITSITSQTFSGDHIILPMINMLKFKEEKDKLACDELKSQNDI